MVEPDLEALRELRTWEVEERIRRLEIRDLEQSAMLDQAESYLKWLNRGLWIGVGGIGIRALQEGGFDLVKSLATLVAGG